MTFGQKYPGWRLSGLLLSILSVVITVGLLASLAVFSKLSDLGSSYIVFEGSCDSSSSISLGIQFAINAISTAILASSNFFMQVIVAPTRRDVDKAHGKRKSVEIGVLSLRNLSSIPRRRVALFLVLGLSSVPIHLFFNSLILESTTSTDALIVLAAETFLRGEQPFSSPGIVVSQTTNLTADAERLEVTLNAISESVQRNTSDWQRIDMDECRSRYNSSNEPLVNYRHAVMVVTDPRQNSTSGWFNENGHNIVATANTSVNSVWTTAYLLRGDPRFPNNTIIQPGGPGAQSNVSNALNHVLNLEGTSLVSSQVFLDGKIGSLEAEYCVSEKYSGDCKLELQLSILAIVCVICVLKLSVELTCMVASRHYRPFITPGDSICSFIIMPDETTAGLCAYERGNFTSLRGKHWRDPYTKSTSPRALHTGKRVLGSALPREVWTSHVITCATIVGVISFYFFANPHPNFNASNFGQNISNPAFLNRLDAVFLDGGVPSLLGTAFLVNLPQLALSIYYVTLNSVFTYFVAEMEWASFGTSYKTLRVTEKKGAQRSTHRLQLPYRYSVPLLISSTLLHWLYSKGTHVAIYDGRGGYYPYDSIRNYGFNGVQVSPSALLVSIILTYVVMPLPLLFALKPRPSAMVLGGTCSAVISAACHSVPLGCQYNPPRVVRGIPSAEENARMPGPGLEDAGRESHESTGDDIDSDSGERERTGVSETSRDTSNRRASLYGETDSSGQDANTTPFITKETEEATALCERMTQEPIKWGLIWRTKLGNNMDPIGRATPYYWIGSVLVPGVEERWLGHLAFGTAVTDVNAQRAGIRYEYQ
ncbi:hypothetical protein SAMD00023353_1700470 [Rosellinia necatrix]|uniref:DUF6536 domain-containing protein n=1 Tax=Rosellinia necatrix TaxID=77044 RepID=A0A1W2TKT0_ROSNE|nr:hypothetical protein SAMD00023353_1700470 [Rosellinia necatrix]